MNSYSGSLHQHDTGIIVLDVRSNDYYFTDPQNSHASLKLTNETVFVTKHFKKTETVVTVVVNGPSTSDTAEK